MKKNILIHVNQDIPEWITPFKDKYKKALRLKEQAENMINPVGSETFNDPDHLRSVIWLLRDCADEALMYIEYLEKKQLPI